MLLFCTTITTQLVFTQVEVIKILVQKKASKQAISAFLRNLEALEVARPKAEVARLRGALNVSKLGCIADVAHLKGELYVVDLQLRMIVTSYLSLQGRLSMRGLLGENGGCYCVYAHDRCTCSPRINCKRAVRLCLLL